jgi:hypothetical protein
MAVIAVSLCGTSFASTIEEITVGGRSALLLSLSDEECAEGPFVIAKVGLSLSAGANVGDAGAIIVAERDHCEIPTSILGYVGDCDYYLDLSRSGSCREFVIYSPLSAINTSSDKSSVELVSYGDPAGVESADHEVAENGTASKASGAIIARYGDTYEITVNDKSATDGVLELYDLRGRLVEQVPCDSDGIYRLSQSGQGSKVASGVYLYRVPIGYARPVVTGKISVVW